jgi:hypothetical protein
MCRLGNLGGRLADGADAALDGYVTTAGGVPATSP